MCVADNRSLLDGKNRSAESRIVRAPLKWGISLSPSAIGLAYIFRGEHGALSALIAIALVLANALAAAIVSAMAGKVSAFSAAMVSLPSFAFRMWAILVAMVLLQNRTFIDKTTFAATFGIAVIFLLVMETRRWARTPWIALTLEGQN